MSIENWFLKYGEVAQYLIFFLLLAVCTILEQLWPRRLNSARQKPRWITNYVLTILNVIVLGALPISLFAAASWSQKQELGLLHMVALPIPIFVVVSLLGRGFISWITHLLMHKIPLFWRVHRVHHLDTELDVSTTVRFHPLEFVLGLVVGLPLIVTFGLSPWVLVLYELLDIAVTLFSHSNIQVPTKIERVLRYLIVTPDLHRVHHSVLPEEADSNFSAVFPVWDRFFGTFREKSIRALSTMPFGLEDIRDDRTKSLSWLLLVPFRTHLKKSEFILSTHEESISTQ